MMWDYLIRGTIVFVLVQSIFIATAWGGTHLLGDTYGGGLGVLVGVVGCVRLWPSLNAAGVAFLHDGVCRECGHQNQGPR